MAKEEPKIEEVVQQVNDALQLFNQAQAPALEEFAALQNSRIKRLKKNATRVTKTLGKEHPRVLAMQRSQARTTQLQQQFKDDAERVAKIPVVKPYEWMVYGRVVDQQGYPVVGVTVRVNDKDRKYNDLLGNTTTDQHGDFQLIYPERAFADLVEKGLELYLRVESQAGVELYSSEDSIHYQGGKIEYYLVKLDVPKAIKKKPILRST